MFVNIFQACGPTYAAVHGRVKGRWVARRKSQDESRQANLRWAHRLGALLCCATFPLISVGGLVTSYDAGMAVPDWPSTYGYNLFLYPWTSWVFGPWDLFIEHGHRLLGAFVGCVTIGLVAAVFWADERRWVRTAACIGLALVIAQGCLGGARVLLDDRQLAMLHGCFGPAFLAYCVALAAFLAPWWQDTSLQRSHPRALRLQRLAWLTVILVYVQLVLGAEMRHIPVTAGRLLFNMSLLLHLGNALLLAVTLTVVWRTHGRRRDLSRLRRPALLLVWLFVVQLVLGAAAWIVTFGWHYWFSGYDFAASFTIRAKSLWQTGTVTLHMAVGSLILSVAVLLALRSMRLLKASPA